MSIELSKVFYNLIPGSAYLVLWIYLYYGELEKINLALHPINRNVNITIVYVLFIVVSIFIGYFLNALWRTLRKCICAENCAKDYKGELTKIDLDVIQQHHATLWYRGKESLSEHFSAIAAMWGNFVVGSILTIVLSGIFFQQNNIFVPNSFVATCLSFFYCF